MKTVPIYLKKISDVVNKEVVKNSKFNTLKTNVDNIEKKIPYGTTLIHINQYNPDKQDLKKKVRDFDKKNARYNTKITKISEVENKIPDTSSLVTTTVLNIKISEADNKTSDISKYITIQKFNGRINK